jgi:hypothetical protein
MVVSTVSMPSKKLKQLKLQAQATTSNMRSGGSRVYGMLPDITAKQSFTGTSEQLTARIYENYRHQN